MNDKKIGKSNKMQVQKLPTGIEGFDDVCRGGLPVSRSTLVITRVLRDTGNPPLQTSSKPSIPVGNFCTCILFDLPIFLSFIVLY